MEYEFKTLRKDDDEFIQNLSRMLLKGWSLYGAFCNECYFLRPKHPQARKSYIAFAGEDVIKVAIKDGWKVMGKDGDTYYLERNQNREVT